MVYFEWDDEIKPVLRVEWKHDTDQPIERYILLLDDKEIQYVCFIINFLFLSMKYFLGRSKIICTEIQIFYK
jgi:hypothetical protein